ncbi:hypothetical protein ACFL2H_12035 [Planctomycetota bacterium]
MPHDWNEASNNIKAAILQSFRNDHDIAEKFDVAELQTWNVPSKKAILIVRDAIGWRQIGLDADDVWDKARDHVKHEDLLTEQRIYNMMTFQAATAVLATIVGGLVGRDSHLGIVDKLIICLPILIGLIHAFFSMFTLTFSKTACSKWATKWRAYSLLTKTDKRPNVVGAREPARWNYTGWWGEFLRWVDGQRLYPLLFAIAWALLMTVLLFGGPFIKDQTSDVGPQTSIEHVVEPNRLSYKSEHTDVVKALPIWSIRQVQSDG